MENNIFEVKSPLYVVGCSNTTWNFHIVSQHSIMANNLSAVKDAIERPLVVYQSSTSPQRDIFFGQSSVATYGQKYYTKVVVEQPSSHNQSGDVVTAFPTKSIKGNIDTEVVKYDGNKSRQKT